MKRAHGSMSAATWMEYNSKVVLKQKTQSENNMTEVLTKPFIVLYAKL